MKNRAAIKCCIKYGTVVLPLGMAAIVLFYPKGLYGFVEDSARFYEHVTQKIGFSQSIRPLKAQSSTVQVSQQKLK